MRCEGIVYKLVFIIQKSLLCARTEDRRRRINNVRLKTFIPIVRLDIATVAISAPATNNSVTAPFVVSSPLPEDSDEDLDSQPDTEPDVELGDFLPAHVRVWPNLPGHAPHWVNHDLDMSDFGNADEIFGDQGYESDQSDATPEVEMQDAPSLDATPADHSDSDESEPYNGPPVTIMPEGLDFSAFGLPLPPGNNPQPLGDPETLLQAMNQAAPLVSNPNPIMLGGSNFGFHDLLRYWATHPRRSGVEIPDAPNVDIVCSLPRDVTEVSYSDLQGESCDMQGIDWREMETNRKAARRFRYQTYKNYTNKIGSDVWMPPMPGVHVPTTDNFYRFKSLLVRRDARLAHFQLRSVLACPSRTQAYYPSQSAVNRINIAAKTTEMAVDLSNVEGLGSVVSALDANCGVLVAGMFNGEYCIQNLNSQSPSRYVDGRITLNPQGITNHLQIYLPRQSSRPVAAFANNDNGFRVMDLTTEEILSECKLPYSINCSSMSPDGRLRVMVGDTFNVRIANAETGQTERELPGHRDFGFSCDWSDDGWTVATGFQDKAIKIWDARKWGDSNGNSTPLTTIRSELASIRNLRFSPNGSGRKVLVAAEEADYIHVIDAQTFESKQTFDIFSEIGGIDFSGEGQNLNALCSDSFRGGLLQFERCGMGSEPFALDIDWRDGFNQRRDSYETLLKKPTMLDDVLFF